MGYLLKNSYHQQKILRARVPVQSVLENPDESLLVKRKLQLVNQARHFAQQNLKLNVSQNYTSYVDLQRPYVTWIVRAAPNNSIKPHTWWFPIVGSVPYLGFFSKGEAEEEASELKKESLDVYVRGVSAYSTLGWFNDPILSTMIAYSDHDLVELIIHENVHATIFIENHADFNEALATYLGQLGAIQFYSTSEQQNKEVVKKIEDEIFDTEVFSKFITNEIQKLKKWYGKNPTFSDSEKENRIEKIKKRFEKNISNQLRTNKFKNFSKQNLNNASLGSFSTYYSDLEAFKEMGKKLNFQFDEILNYCKSLRKKKDPLSHLKDFVKSSH